MDNGFERVTLAKPWLGKAVGEEAEVDAERAGWLGANGYLGGGERPATATGTAPATGVSPPAIVAATVKPPPVGAVAETASPATLSELPLKGNK